MVAVRLAAALLILLALAGGVTSSTSAAGNAPENLHGFLLRADEPRRTNDEFPRTPAFAWDPVPNAVKYDFQMAMSSTFRQSAYFVELTDLTSPVAAPALTLPWITGSQHSLYARVRATLDDGTTTPWSASYGFDMVPPPPPKPMPSVPGLLRWTPVDGANGYQVWLIDVPGDKANKITSFTNVLDEREFYTFHQSSKWIATVRWRIRALRNTTALPDAKVPAVQYGAWSSIYTSTNPDVTSGVITLAGKPSSGTISDVISDGGPTAPGHRLMPGFFWTGNQAADGTQAELFRVYVFTDKQCINRVFTSALVGSQAYAPRPGGPLALPTGSLASARGSYLPQGSEPMGTMYDGTTVSATEEAGAAAGTSPLDGTTPDTAAIAGAQVDLWDQNWPEGGYYWTVIPVAAVVPPSLQTNVAAPGSPATATSVPVTSSDGFASGDAVTVGNAGSAEVATVAAVSATSLTLAGALKFNHGQGEPIVRTAGSLRYQDLEMPQDVCAAGRRARFGKESEPTLASSGQLFASGLSPRSALTLKTGRTTDSFYKAPLVSWTPALGAESYEIQWSKTDNPFDSKSGGSKKLSATSFVLPVTPGTWYYRVRGYDRSVPGTLGMSWSETAKIEITKPSFAVVPTQSATTTQSTKKLTKTKKKP